MGEKNKVDTILHVIFPIVINQDGPENEATNVDQAEEQQVEPKKKRRKTDDGAITVHIVISLSSVTGGG